MTYVDGFLIRIPKNKVAAYKKMATFGGKLWKKYGAVDYKECVLDDMPKGFSGMPFPKIARTRPKETVIFSYITYKSKAHRNAVNKKVMSDPSMKNYNPKDMPFTEKDMSYGGFKVLVDM
jgi:uncharacterized protein YbaA (DUF1428 family)